MINILNYFCFNYNSKVINIDLNDYYELIYEIVTICVVKTLISILCKNHSMWKCSMCWFQAYPLAYGTGILILAKRKLNDCSAQTELNLKFKIELT